MKNLRNVGIVTSVVGAAVTLAIMYSVTSAADGVSDLLITLGFYVWVLFPFVVLVVLTSYIHRKGLSDAARVAALLTSILVVVSSVLIYRSSIYDSETSTSSLVFVFIPLYTLGAIKEFPHEKNHAPRLGRLPARPRIGIWKAAQQGSGRAVRPTDATRRNAC